MGHWNWLAERGVDALMAAGFSSSDISVLLPQSTSTKEFAHEKHTKAPEGTTTGVVGGAGMISSDWLMIRALCA